MKQGVSISDSHETAGDGKEQEGKRMKQSNTLGI